MILQNSTTGETLRVHIRPFVPGDAASVIGCIRDAYGDTYVKPDLYSEAKVVAHNDRGLLSFAVAETDGGEIAGIIAVEVSPHFPGQAEIVCQVIRRLYSGYGLALPLARYQLRRAEEGAYHSIFARALGCHLISQKTLADMDFIPCGFLMSVFDKERFDHHYQNGGYSKIPQSVAVKRGSKHRAGTIWLPKGLHALAAELYQCLGMAYTPISHTEPLSGPGLWDQDWDRVHHTLTLWARRCGWDFATHLDRWLGECGGHPLFTVNLYLNLTDPAAGAAWQEAEKRGFLFTGFLPCGGDGEYLILHQPGALSVSMDIIPYLPAYEPFAAEIRRQVNERN